jgi:HPt (histidine-containing phosphotransfer) domain-containing protein
MEIEMASASPWAGSPEPEHITRIRVLFAARLPERVRRIREGFESIVNGQDDEARDGARVVLHEAHRLAGSAESFGGLRLGEIAARIDQSLRSYHDEGVVPPKDVIEGLPPLIGELEMAEEEFLRWVEGNSSDLVGDEGEPDSEDSKGSEDSRRREEG